MASSYTGPGQEPKRWGRMDNLSRAAVTGVGLALEKADLLEPDTGRLINDIVVGLVAGSQWGSLATDLDYAATLSQGFAMASPTIFSYTLPNIGLAEAASQFGLLGPVYALFSKNPQQEAEREANRWLSSSPGVDVMLAGVLDVPLPTNAALPVANFILLRKS